MVQTKIRQEAAGHGPHPPKTYLDLNADVDQRYSYRGLNVK